MGERELPMGERELPIRSNRLLLVGCAVAMVAGPMLGAAVTLGVVAVDAVGQSRHVIGEVRQPANVTYPDGHTHVAALRSVRSWLFRRREPYELVVGSSPSYGHVLRLDIPGGTPAIAGATWDASGVRVRLRSGHEVFVPARYFLYGR